DVIWARTTAAGTLTLDGNLTEPAWDKAEELKIVYGETSGLPTSGWRAEFQEDAIYDPTNATVKFLVEGKYLYLGFTMPDSSVGGTQDWARWDGILMSIKDKTTLTNGMALPGEFFYTFWSAGTQSPETVLPGGEPYFISGNTSGRFAGDWGAVNVRTAEQKAAWDAKTVVRGKSNDDTTPDIDWVVEMRIDMSMLGYNFSNPSGETIMLNLSIWDQDWVFSGKPEKVTSMRTHWQSPWGNAAANNTGRVMVSPDVTINTETLPEIVPDIIIPNGANYAAPVIDGLPNETVWEGAYSFEIAWDDVNIRNSYPGVGPYVSGQFQPELNGNPKPPVIDPSHATIKMFYKDNYLYVSGKVSDQLVQGKESFDDIDGFAFIIGDRASMNDDHFLNFSYLRMNYGEDGTPKANDQLPSMIDAGAAEYAMKLLGASTVNKNDDIDEGYTFELKIDLNMVGYPGNLGDRILFMGAMLADGDSFDDALANYGTRTWWFREHGGGPATPWAFLSPTKLVVGIEDETSNIIPDAFSLIGNYPNPFNPSTKIKFAIPEAGNVSINIFNILGQRVFLNDFPGLTAGVHEFNFNASNFASGNYFYQVSFTNSSSGKTLYSKTGKMMLLK
ncbi:MAG: T9SS type A sorting domain-containing protein, partial [Bacteroidetes bacterium]|nr:T9SS type A sorting domain-containing protein [Bacteroidota bacterium]